MVLRSEMGNFLGGLTNHTMRYVILNQRFTLEARIAELNKELIAISVTYMLRNVTLFYVIFFTMENNVTRFPHFWISVLIWISDEN